MALVARVRSITVFGDSNKATSYESNQIWRTAKATVLDLQPRTTRSRRILNQRSTPQLGIIASLPHLASITVRLCRVSRQRHVAFVTQCTAVHRVKRNAEPGDHAQFGGWRLLAVIHAGAC